MLSLKLRDFGGELLPRNFTHTRTHTHMHTYTRIKIVVCVCACVKFRGSNSPPKSRSFSDSSSNPPSLAAPRIVSLPPSPAVSLRARANAVNLRRNCKWSTPDLDFSGSSSLYRNPRFPPPQASRICNKQSHSYYHISCILFRPQSLRAQRVRHMCQQMLKNLLYCTVPYLSQQLRCAAL